MSLQGEQLQQLEGIDWQRIGLKSHACHACHTVFDTKAELLVHDPCFRRSKQYNSSGDRKNRFGCKFCDFRTVCLLKLRQHISSHLDKTFKCNHCGFSFSRSYNLFRHLASVHYSCKCPIRSCVQRFSGRNLLKKHLREKHGERSVRECKSCRAIFVTDMGRHTKTCKGSMNKKSRKGQ